MQHFYSTNFITTRPTKKVAKNFAMTDFSSSSVPQNKPDKISDDIAKISIKSEKTTTLGELLYIREYFSHHVSPQRFVDNDAGGHSLTLKNRHLLTTHANQPEAEPMYTPSTAIGMSASEWK